MCSSDLVSRRPSLPAQLPESLVDDLPEACGVYRFIGEGDSLLYVGKALNLRERVLAHFMSAGRDTKSQRLAAQVRRVEWTETAGEFGALLLEARLVRERQPVYNRRLRGGGGLHAWSVGDDGAAPQLLALEGPLPASDLFGLYRSARQARNALTTLARDHKLCLRVLGLESGGEGSCFGHQVGRCAGACVGVESRAKHNLRLKLALAPQKLRAWPHPGAVALEETSALGLRQWHVIDGWQYLGTVHPDGGDGEGLPGDAPLAARTGFDPDVYRILARHLPRLRKGLRPWPPAARR